VSYAKADIMVKFLATAVVTALFFGLAITAMAVGLILRGKIMRGGCGSTPHGDAPDVGCEACSKKRLNLCDENDTTGLAGPSFSATLGRFSHKP